MKKTIAGMAVLGVFCGVVFGVRADDAAAKRTTLTKMMEKENVQTYLDDKRAYYVKAFEAGEIGSEKWTPGFKVEIDIDSFLAHVNEKNDKNWADQTSLDIKQGCGDAVWILIGELANNKKGKGLQIAKSLTKIVCKGDKWRAGANAGDGSGKLNWTSPTLDKGGLLTLYAPVGGTSNGRDTGHKTFFALRMKYQLGGECPSNNYECGKENCWGYPKRANGTCMKCVRRGPQQCSPKRTAYNPVAKTWYTVPESCWSGCAAWK